MLGSIPWRTAEAQAPVAGAPPQFARPVPQGSPLPRILPPPPPAVAPGAAAPALPSAGEVPNRPVKVTSVTIEGVTAFPLPEIAAYTDGLTGAAVPLPRIDASRLEILRRYRSEGYVLTTVSVSLDARGALRFIVTEGRIGSVKLDGDIGPAGTQVLRFLNPLIGQQPIKLGDIERALLLAQDVPGVTLRAVLEPAQDTPGAVNLVAQVARKPVSGLAAFDNRAFNQTGPNESLLVLDLNSFTEFGEKTQLSYYHAFPNTQNFGQISSEFFIGGSGLKMRIYAGYGGAVPTGSATSGLQLIGYHGNTTVFGAALSYPVIRSRQQTFTTTVSLDAIESVTNTSLSGVGRVTSDSVRAARIGAEYAMFDTWLGDSRTATNAIAVRLSQGLDALGASGANRADALRLNEDPSFTKVNFEVSRTQTLFAPWEGASVALMGLLAGQYSGDVLPPAEQFYLGGLRLARGYYAGQVVGDKALAATAELQLNTALDLSGFGFSTEIASQFYLFYDWGETWQNQSIDFATRVSSAGGGVRLQVTSYAELDFEALGRFNKYPTGTGPNVGALNGIGLYWRVLGRF